MDANKTNALQKKIFNIVKKKSFTPSSMIRILRKVIKEKNSSTISTLDIVEGTILNNRSHYAKKITSLYKTEKILPKTHHKLSDSRQKMINLIYNDFLKINGFFIPKEGFEYVMNKIISRISKDIKMENMSKLNISRDKNNNWNVLDYAVSSKIINIKDKTPKNGTTFLDKEKNISDNIKDFRNAIINRIYVKKDEEYNFIKDILTEDFLLYILKNNFDNDFAKAISLLRGENLDYYKNLFDKEIEKIHNLNYSSDKIFRLLSEGKKLLFITDSDNDGSSGQAGINVFKKSLPQKMQDLIIVKYAKTFKQSKMSHGLNAIHINELIENKEITPEEISLLITVDNGMSLTKEEVRSVLKLLPNSDLLITDHHLPSENLVKETTDSEKIRISNPKYKPSSYFKKEKNISGAQTINEILKRSLKKLENNNTKEEFINVETNIKLIDNISKFSNIADVIDADISQYPLKDYDIDRLSSISTMLNVVNNMNTFIGKKISIEAFSKLCETDLEEANSFANTLLYLNSISKEYISLFDKLFSEEINYSLNEKTFSKEFADINRDFKIKEYEVNYIALLRPIIIELTNDTHKNIFKTKFLDNIEKVFKELKKAQNKIVESIRNKPLNFIEDSKKLGLETEKVSILLKKDTPELKELNINRKLFNIALNEANNGFRAILDSLDENSLSGSLRSLYPKSKIFENKSEIETELGIQQTLMGHEKAAGWKINIPNLKNTPKKEVIKKLSKLTEWIEEKIIKYEENNQETINNRQTSIYSTDKCDLLLKINTAVFSSFQGKKGIDTNLYLDEYQIETLNRKIKNTKFGWITLDTKIMDATMIIPIEVLKKYIKMKKEGKKVSLSFENLTSSSLILKGIRENDKDVFVEKEKTLEKYYEEYIEKNYKNNKEYLTNSDLQKQPYFQYNKYGDIEFQRMQATIIELMYRYNLSDYNILDIEGTGLAMSEEIPEISTLTLKIDEKSGKKLTVEEFFERHFVSHGREILVDKKDLNTLIKVEENELKNYNSKYLIYHEDSEQWFYNKNKKHFPEVFSKKIENGEVIYNKQLIGVHIHTYINNLIENIPTSIESLTHLSNDLIKNSKNSLSLQEADELFFKYFSSMDNALLSAHNLSYDYSLIRSNFPKTFEYMHKNMLLYDTAKTSQAVRLDSQQFASIELPIAVGDLPNPKVKFKNYFGNNLSLEEFFEDLGDGREIADRTGRFFLKVSDNNLFFIDREKDISAILLSNVRDMDKYELKEWLNYKKDVSVAPKYSVNSLLHEKYVKMMLQKIAPVSEIEISYNSIEKMPVLEEEFEEFIKKYRFENSIETNINTFIDYIKIKYKSLNLPSGEFIIKHFLNKEFPYKSKEGKPSVRESNKHIKNIYEQYMEQMKKNIEKFISNNKEISAIYTNRFYAEEVIHLLPENLDIITEDTISIISSKTSYNKDFIKEIIENVKKFKEINGLNIFAIEEAHNNLVGKDSTKMGDVAIEGMLVIVHLLNEKYNFLNKTNLITQAVDFIEKGIIETAKIDFNKREKEEITASQINSETFKIGKNLSSLSYSSYKTNFTKKIDKTIQGNTKLLKINERVIQENVLIKADIPKNMSDSEVEKIVEDINIYMFLENLKKAKEDIKIYIYNLINSNKKNFIVNFGKYFKESIEKHINLIKSRTESLKHLESERFHTYTSVEMYENLNEVFKKIDEEIIELELLENDNEVKNLNDFKKELDKVYEKANSLKMIDELLDSISEDLSLKQEKLIQKYNLYFDYNTANRKFKISNEIFELLGELQEINRESFSRFYLSPKFVKREKKSIGKAIISDEEFEDFKNKLENFINEEVINKMHFPETFRYKINNHLDFLLNFYFIKESVFNECEEVVQNEILKNNIHNFNGNTKKFNNPSKEIVESFDKMGTGLSKFIIETKLEEKGKKDKENKNKTIKNKK